MTKIKQNLETIKEKISSAEKRSNRQIDSVKLIAVSKFHTREEVEIAIQNGQFIFGENRVQEAYEKFVPILQTFPNVELHIIGQLQTNKVKKAVEIASCIQSVDRIELLQEIEKQCSKINKNIEVLFEFHTAEDSKSGFKSENDLLEVLKSFQNGEFSHITPKGFMTMAPFTTDESLIRKSFITLRELSQKMQKLFPEFSLTELSMGMSNDYEIAINEGATIVRVGTAIFGEREYK